MQWANRSERVCVLQAQKNPFSGVLRQGAFTPCKQRLCRLPASLPAYLPGSLRTNPDQAMQQHSPHEVLLCCGVGLEQQLLPVDSQVVQQP
jgi:hypothetical protein